ncbi:MAG: ABC transporter permease, partial [Chloroflexota bacterium]|nr:ABC transporter permease [Chloroflexota bacterium]
MVSLRRYTLRRLLLAFVTLCGVVVVVFFITRILPGNPAAVRLGPYASPQLMAAMQKEMGLDQPLPVQFVNYVGKLAHGDLGKSWRTGQGVRDDLEQRLPATLELALAATIIAIAVGMVLGSLAALSQNSWFDQAVRVLTIFGASTAIFWLALVFIYIFYYRLGWAAPPLDRLAISVPPPARLTGLFTVDALLSGNVTALKDALHHLALPALTLAFVVSAPITKIVRAALLDQLHADYVRTAKT